MAMIPGDFSQSYERDIAIFRTKTQWVVMVIGLAIMLTFPLFMSNYWLSLFNFIFVTVIAVLGLHLVTGLCGQISLGQSALMCVGAYTVGVLSVKFGISVWACLPLAGLVTGLIGMIFGAPALRVKEFYLAMSTLAAQFIIVWVVSHLEEWTGGQLGMYVPPATIGGFSSASPSNLFYIGFILTIVMIAVAKNIQRTRVGRAFIAIRDNDIAAEVMGINLFRYKLLAFFIGCFFAGIAGWMWAMYLQNINPSQFTLKESLWMLGMVIVGGMGSTTGAVMGAVFVRGLDMIADYASAWAGTVFPTIGEQAFTAFSLIIFGLVIVIFLIYEPRGLYHRWELFKASYRLHPYAY
jgi:branched-chain amino acid transport system permease protein